MNDVQLCLLAAKTLISYPEDYSVTWMAADYGGQDVNAVSPEAVQWSTEGATLACAPLDLAMRTIKPRAELAVLLQAIERDETRFAPAGWGAESGAA